MTSLLKKPLVLYKEDVHSPIHENPLRIAFLGGPKSGKSSTIAKLTMGTFTETHYPTHQIQPILHNFAPTSFSARCILDEVEIESSLGYLSKQPNIVLSPVIYQSYAKPKVPKKPVNGGSSSQELNVNSKNPYYISYFENNDNNIGNSGYVPPQVSPILIDLIDTPSFDPKRVVPFLEASMYVKLSKEILHNLANEPRKAVSTNPLLVASGASEMNGNIDGYFFVYSAVPSYHPPSYEEKELVPVPSPPNNDPNIPTLEQLPGDDTFNLLSIMKGALDEAWKEYTSFKIRWSQGQEHDIFSFKRALKTLWKEKNLLDNDNMKDELKKRLKLESNSLDPSDPDCPPPIWIICTHSDNQLASPKLIENGIKVAKFWKCGFVAIDNMDDDVDDVLALLMREIVERKKLQKGKKKIS